MHNRRVILLVAVLLFSSATALWAQVTGGQNSFSFLEISPSARATALGGNQIAVRDEELVFASLNPAALNPQMSGRLAFNHNNYLSDIRYGHVAFGQQLEKVGHMLYAAVQYADYGSIQRADVFGNQLGDIPVKETAITVGTSRSLSDKLSLGLNMKLAMSTLDVYSAVALAADAGLLYADTAKRYSIGLVLRNAGAQLTTYTGTREELPFDLQVGYSKRLEHLPFRFTLIAHHLHQWDIRYDDPALKQEATTDFGGAVTEPKGAPGIDNLFRHLLFNGEFLLGKTEGFRIRFGYNHLRRRELSVLNYSSLAGFSAGVGVKINRFRVDFGYGGFHLGGGSVHLGIGTNLKSFL